MEISIQYIEGGASAKRISPRAARTRLREAFSRTPLSRVLLGWDLDVHVVEACADECARHRSELYLWQPMLTGHGDLVADPECRVVGLDGDTVPGLNEQPEFTFLCPNRPAVRDRAVRCLTDALVSGYYHGVFLDRIRFPSPAANIARHLGCFCSACHQVAQDEGLDLQAVRQGVSRLLHSTEGRHAIIEDILSASRTHGVEGDPRLLRCVLEFRERSIDRFVAEVAQVAYSKGLKVGLDCFSPSLTRMVGQDLATLARSSNWIKVMTYARAFAPASLPYEVVGLASWLSSFGEEAEPQILEFLGASTGWSIPHSRAVMQSGGLPSTVLKHEIDIGRAAGVPALLAGIELVEMPGVSHLTTAQIQGDASAIRAGQPDGVVLCWDLWQMPLKRVELAGALFGAGA